MHAADQVNLTVKRLRRLKRNEILCLPKKPFQNLYAIQSGALKAYQVEADGKERIRGFYFAGEVFGYEAIYTGNYLFTTVALSETVICENPYDNFLALISSQPTLQKHILYLLSQQLNIGSYLAATTAEQQIAGFLLDLSARLYASGTPLEFSPPMSRQDMGNYLRLTPETISRIFSLLQKNKIIAAVNKTIRMLQPEKLQQIADGLLSIQVA